MQFKEKGDRGIIRHSFTDDSGFCEHIDSKASLVNLSTKIIFQSSAMHAAVNFLQFEYGCFAPNVPALMRGSIPKEEDRGHIDMARILDSLPGLRASLVQAGAAFTLSEFSKDEVFLTSTPTQWLFTEESALGARQYFQKNLRDLDNAIQERNQKLTGEGKIPYHVLKPSRVPCGIAI